MKLRKNYILRNKFSLFKIYKKCRQIIKIYYNYYLKMNWPELAGTYRLLSNQKIIINYTILTNKRSYQRITYPLVEQQQNTPT